MRWLLLPPLIYIGFEVGPAWWWWWARFIKKKNKETKGWKWRNSKGPIFNINSFIILIVVFFLRNMCWFSRIGALSKILDWGITILLSSYTLNFGLFDSWVRSCRNGRICGLLHIWKSTKVVSSTMLMLKAHGWLIYQLDWMTLIHPSAAGIRPLPFLYHNRRKLVIKWRRKKKKGSPVTTQSGKKK